jgi:hypothetical protein
MRQADSEIPAPRGQLPSKSLVLIPLLTLTKTNRTGMRHPSYNMMK